MKTVKVYRNKKLINQIQGENMSEHTYKSKPFSKARPSYDKEKSWDSDLEVCILSKEYAGKNIKVRLATQITPFLRHWIPTKPSDMALSYKERTGSCFPVWCPDFDCDSEESSRDTCEVCMNFSDKKKLGKGQVVYYVQGFIWHKNKKGEGTWGELRVIALDVGAIREIQNIIETSGNGIEPNSAKDGYSIWLKYDNSAMPAKWSAQKAEDIPLKKISSFNKEDIIDFSEMFKPTSAKSIKESLTRLGYYNESSDFDDDDDEQKPKKKKHSSEEDSDFDDDDDEPKSTKSHTEEDDEEEDEKPKKKKKHHSKDDDDFEDDSEDEEDEPKSRKHHKDDDDDDEDEKPKKKKKHSEDDEDDDDDFEDDSEDEEDDEDEKPKKKKKHSEDDEDDDEEDDDDNEDGEDEEDDEDEKPKKKKSKDYDWED